jgi:signal transduction histidine kinase
MHEPHQNHELKLYRIAFILGATLYPLFGYIYSDLYFDFNFDGFWERSSVGFLSIMFLGVSFFKNISLRSIRLLVLAIALIITTQYYYFASLSHYHWVYITGLIQIPAICIVVFYKKIDAVIYFLAIILGSFILLKESPFIKGSYPMLISTYVGIYYLYFSNRENLTKDLQNKINEIRSKQSQIEEKNRSLIKIGELATQVAHDIRSPVTALEAVSQMLGDEIDPQKKKLIKNAAKRINDIANNLVAEYRENLTKDLSTVSIDRTVTINNLIEDVIEEKKLLLDTRYKIDFIAPESISVPNEFDTSEFQRVISNIINNSIEAIDKQNGLIDISLRRGGDGVEVVIRDNGKGIDTKQISQVFDKGISGKPRGAGLGLSHARKHLESIGGTIRIESKVAIGSTVTISIK